MLKLFMRVVLAGAALLSGVAGHADVLTFKDSGVITSDPANGDQHWYATSIAGLRYERVTVVDTGVATATYQDVRVASELEELYLRRLAGGSGATNMAGTPVPSPGFTSFTFSVYAQGSNVPLFTISADGSRVSSIERYYGIGDPAPKLSILSNSPFAASQAAAGGTYSTLTLMRGLNTPIPVAPGFIEPGMYALPADTVVGTVGAARYDQSTFEEELRAVLVADYVQVLVTAVPELPMPLLLALGLLTLAARRRLSR